MVQTLQQDAKINWRQCQNTFFQLGFVGEFEPCQKNFFQSQNSNRSKQTAEKLNKWEIKIMVFFDHQIGLDHLELIINSIFRVCPTQVCLDKMDPQRLRVRCELLFSCKRYEFFFVIWRNETIFLRLIWVMTYHRIAKTTWCCIKKVWKSSDWRPPF